MFNLFVRIDRKLIEHNEMISKMEEILHHIKNFIPKEKETRSFATKNLTKAVSPSSERVATEQFEAHASDPKNDTDLANTKNERKIQDEVAAHFKVKMKLVR